MNKLIYVADDEVNICNIIKSFLLKEGFEVKAFNDGSSVLEAFNDRPADLLVLDVMMPGMDGYSLCSAIRSKSAVPIIIVSAKDTEPDRIAGLNLGSDDYLTKPFSPMELIARINSIFRRIEMDRSGTTENNITKISDISVDKKAKLVKCCDKAIPLTGMEYAFLNYLFENKNRPVSRNELLDKLWGFENEVETRATDDMMKRIRKKLTYAGSALKIETIWGFGFKISDKD